MELPPRLRLLASWVPEGTRLADVGTDHGYLPTWLRLHGRIQWAVASDLRKGPLERARATGALYGTNQIDYRLCSGLEAIGPDEVDTIVIAGMGGENIVSILKAADWTARGVYTLLLQPQTHEELLRQFLAENGFAIVREELVWDRGKLYTAIKAEPGQMHLSPAQIWGGVHLLHDPLGGQYLDGKLRRAEKALAGLVRSERPEDRARRERLREAEKALLQAREEWRCANSQEN